MEALVAALVVAAAAGGVAIVTLLRRQAMLQIGGAGTAGGRRRRGLDPFAVNEPWRRFVQDALQAQGRLDEVLRHVRPGPLRDRLADIARRMDDGVGEVWVTAQQGQALRSARRRIDVPALERRLDDARAEEARHRAAEPLSIDDTATRTVQSLEGQLDSARRLDEVTSRAEARLKLLQAQMDEAVARAAELAAASAADATALAGLGDDVEHVVEELEALRLALQETSGGVSPA
jgi:hypothetical protein